jgi:hypothetical protein
MLSVPGAKDSEESPPTSKVARDDEGLRAGLMAEVVFAALPLLLILLVFAHTKRLGELFASPEWSFGSAILLGQTLAKFVSGLAKSGQTRPGAAALVTALLLVFGLAPALITLALMLEAERGPAEPSAWLQALQVIYFIGASILYVIMGDVSERRK